MRFYTEEEITTLTKLFNEEYSKEPSFVDLKYSSPLTEDDLRTTKTMKFSEFKEKYKLSIGDDTYDLHRETIKNGVSGINPEYADHNTYNPHDLRYPLVILCCSYYKDERHADMVHFLEYQYTIEHYDDEDLEIIVVDKMTRPFDKVLLSKVADYYGFDDFDFSVYE